MADRDKQIRLFERIAQQRLDASEVLLGHDYCLDAVYLAGYAVECWLKALILRWTPRRDFKVVLQKLTEVGAKGHNLEYLKSILKAQHGREDKRDRETLGALGIHLKNTVIWTTDLRYQVSRFDPDEARRFFEAVRAIRDIYVRS